MLQLLLVALFAAPQPVETADAVLVLRTGHKLYVRSYEVDGRAVRIVNRDGEPQIMRADMVDIDRSARATERHLAARAAAAEAAAEAARERAAAAERRAHETRRSRSRSGTLLLMEDGAIREIAEPAEERADAGGDAGKVRRIRRIESKPSLLVFEAKWCGWCRKLKSRVLSDRGVRAALSGYKVHYIDIDRDATTAAKYGIRSVPALVALDPSGRRVKSQTGFLEKRAFLSWLAR